MKKAITHKQPDIASEMRFGPNSKRAFGNNLEVTASDRKVLLAAFNNYEYHVELGAAIGRDIYQAANREGFMRRFLFKADLEQGQEPRAFMRNKDVVAVVATSAVR